MIRAAHRVVLGSCWDLGGRSRFNMLFQTLLLPSAPTVKACDVVGRSVESRDTAVEQFGAESEIVQCVLLL